MYKCISKQCNNVVNNSDKIVGEVVLTSEYNDGDYNFEISGSNISNYNDEVIRVCVERLNAVSYTHLKLHTNYIMLSRLYFTEFV